MKDLNLYIDGSRSGEIELKLFVGKNLIDKQNLMNLYKRPDMLVEINNLLNKNNKKISDLKYLSVHRGPGSFSGLRVSAAIANTISFLLKIPVNNKNRVELIYE